MHALNIQVMELLSPVEDSRGYIYEEAQVVQALRTARGAAIQCPVAGERQPNIAAFSDLKSSQFLNDSV
jgi:hypothetical protein